MNLHLQEIKSDLNIEMEISEPTNKEDVYKHVLLCGP